MEKSSAYRWNLANFKPLTINNSEEENNSIVNKEEKYQNNEETETSNKHDKLK